MRSPAALFVPTPIARDRHTTHIHAPAALAFDTAATLDMQQAPLVRRLIQVRAALMGDAPAARPSTRLVDEMLAVGWGILAREAGRLLVMGAAARPWARNVTFVPLSAGEFAAFREPNLVKIVWTLEAEPLGPDATRFSVETRVAATDAAARWKFRAYWLVFSIGIRLIRWAVLRELRRQAEQRYGGAGAA